MRKEDTFEEYISFTKFAIKKEQSRIRAWMKRKDPLTGSTFDFFEALSAVIHNNPSFDEMWDMEFRKRK